MLCSPRLRAAIGRQRALPTDLSRQIPGR